MKELDKERAETREKFIPAPPDPGDEMPYGDPRGEMPIKTDSPWKPLVINAIVALVIVFAMNSFIMPTIGKKAYIADITRLENDLVAMRAIETSLSNKVTALENTNKENTNIINDAISKATKDIEAQATAITNSLSGYAPKTETESLKLEINNTQANISSLQSKLEEIEEGQELAIKSALSEEITNAGYPNGMPNLANELSALATRITELEDKQEAITTPSLGITATVKTISSTLIASSNTTLTGSFKIALANNTNSAISDIILDISIQTGIAVNIGSPASGTLTGGSTIWQGQGIPWNTAEFVNTQWGLNLAANETKTLYLTYVITGTGFMESPQNYHIYGVPFQVGVTVL